MYKDKNFYSSKTEVYSDDDWGELHVRNGFGNWYNQFDDSWGYEWISKQKQSRKLLDNHNNGMGDVYKRQDLNS